MARFHIVVAAALIACASIGVIGLELNQPAFTALFSVGGWLVSAVAIVVALLLVVLLGIRSFTGTARPLLRRSWLGLVNGVAALGFWVVFGL